MEQTDLVNKLKQLKSSGITNKEIEALFGLAKNSLSNILNEKIPVPRKSWDAIKNYEPVTDWEKKLRNQLWEDIFNFGICVTKTDEAGIKRVDPMSNEAAAIRYGIISTKMTIEEVKEKFGVEVILQKAAEAVKPEIKQEVKKERGATSKFKTYDYSAMPAGLNYAGREAWKKKARIEQDKL